ncbi:dolichyl-diphosphooligosaccharide-protein glycotransferase [Nitzschia inconspicua]|uniref:dolichyl-diphosphooligosaccharide--protein glycotransferase n=1 Tax=Nitzschia inconspicua TaxID=303405 RepID=A0A9K3LSI5_9STRA|nr:dolichyl-diphosphooligosaccharide-protein glycotransferase [Nitzschia inconspicua]
MAKSSSAPSSSVSAKATAKTANVAGVDTTTEGVATDSDASTLYSYAWVGVIAYFIILIIYNAYRIRMAAIDEYGPVIHEFDPYFNYRATEYLYEHGAKEFFEWFDYMVWYPLGRPVGTTIYPGMQFTAVYIKRYLLDNWSLNDVCCYIPAWFGAIATVVVGLLTYECSIPCNSSSSLAQWLLDLIWGGKSETTPDNRPLALGIFSPALECATFAAGMMAIVPAHLMRSVGGGYDNESIANTAMVLTFYFWVRSLRNDNSAWMGALAGLAYFYMVAAWGGYIFVLNLVGVHAATLVAFGRYSPKVYLSYTLFYVIGTSLAIQVPVVGWAPLKSLEQLGPCAVFCGYQLLRICDYLKGKKEWTRGQMFKLRARVFLIAGACTILLIMAVAPKGYFGPMSSRVRGLFVKHTKTGNPLVDSVAEHQPASSRAYFQYLHHVCSLAPIGFIMVMANLSDSSSFLLVWGMTSYFFSHKMVRLILLTAPIGSTLGGIAAGRMFTWSIRQWWENDGMTDSKDSASGGQSAKAAAAAASKKGIKPKKPIRRTTSSDGFESLAQIKSSFSEILSTSEGLLARRTISCLLLVLGYLLGVNFTNYSWRLSQDLSNPTIIVKARLRDGKIIKLDDYREAYWWLRDNTPPDSRIMAWWDYGYQITAIANRTTIADGNTWNHEHIALLGKALTASEEEGYEIARHLADYVLIWGGGGGDDLAKSPHLARIANSVYRDHCPPGDPTCRAFGFIDRQGTPSPMMERSLLYRLHGNQIKKGVNADKEKWEEVYRSKYGRVRIYKIKGVSEESKAWVSDPANRVCDVPGSWFCPGQYPPGLANILSRKKDFAQLEDFNRGEADEEYQKQYFEMLNNPEKAQKLARQVEREQKEKQAVEGGSEAPPRDETAKKKVDEIYNTWEDTEDTTLMWSLITNNQVDDLKMWLEEDPTVAFIRSRDGRGPMWWAFEQRNEEITKLLMAAGVPHSDRDAKGNTPVDLLEGSGK